MSCRHCGGTGQHSYQRETDHLGGTITSYGYCDYCTAGHRVRAADIQAEIDSRNRENAAREYADNNIGEPKNHDD